MDWTGVIPAITTPFHADLSVDHAFFTKHCQWLIENGCLGVVALGSLGEGATLTFDEKEAVLRTAVTAVGPDVPVVAGVSARSTDVAVRIAKMAEAAGCRGLMVLPPYVYVGDWREMKAHVAAILRATSLSAMLYNNPIAYKTDFLPEQVNELINEHANLHAIKESSADIRRIAALRILTGSHLKVLVGVDDLIFEAGMAGATGWIAGLVNAFPAESVELFDASIRGDKARAMELYKWFLPMLRMDTVPKFVQLIKLAQAEVGMGSARVRPPRLELIGAELAEAQRIIREALANRP